MQSSPNDEYLIAASPVYIAAVQNDILKALRVWLILLRN